MVMEMDSLKKYLLIVNGVAVDLLEIAGAPPGMANPDWVWVDVADITPLPAVGWAATNENGVWSFTPPVNPQDDMERLAAIARSSRDMLMRSVYDPGVMMAMRAIRMAASEEERLYAETKLSELDEYAVSLTNIPEQEGFPQNIQWPQDPVK